MIPIESRIAKAALYIFYKPSKRRVWWSTAVAFFLIMIAVVSQMSYIREAVPTLPWVLSWGIPAFAISVLIKWRRQGREALREHIFKHLFDTLIPAVSIIVTIFLYRLLWTVPQTINAQFLSIKLPIPSFGPPSSDMCKLDPGACAPRPPTPVLITPNHPGRRDDPRLAVVEEANDLANKIQNIGDDLSVQITAEHQRLIDLQSRWGQARAESERPFVLMSIDDIHAMEMQRYEHNYEKRALAVREKILAEIPDVPIKLDPNSSSTINTMTVSFMYTHPTNPNGYRMVARNLRDLAFAYKAKITATPLPKQ
jgi:hypothetical protein